MVQQPSVVYTDVVCGGCRGELKPVFPEDVNAQGEWRALQADDALQILVSGGYGMYMDEVGREPSRSVFLLCRQCVDALRKVIPGLHQILASEEAPIQYS
jgi:hypothetical protein